MCSVVSRQPLLARLLTAAVMRCMTLHIHTCRHTPHTKHNTCLNGKTVQEGLENEKSWKSKRQLCSTCWIGQVRSNIYNRWHSWHLQTEIWQNKEKVFNKNKAWVVESVSPATFGRWRTARRCFWHWPNLGSLVVVELLLLPSCRRQTDKHFVRHETVGIRDHVMRTWQFREIWLVRSCRHLKSGAKTSRQYSPSLVPRRGVIWERRLMPAARASSDIMWLGVALFLAGKTRVETRGEDGCWQHGWVWWCCSPKKHLLQQNDRARIWEPGSRNHREGTQWSSEAFGQQPWYLPPDWDKEEKTRGRRRWNCVFN